MNKVQRCRKAIKQLCFAYIPQINLLFIRNYSIKKDLNINVTKDKKQSEKTESANFKEIPQFSKDLEVKNNLLTPRQDTFASLLRNSKFIDVNMKYFITLHYIILFNFFFLFFFYNLYIFFILIYLLY